MAEATIDLAQDQETRAKADEKPQASKFWLGEIAAAKKRDEKWYKRADAVVARYRDERERSTGGEQRINILWSNTEILKAALFQGLGNPDVRRRFPKRGDDDRAARQAAIVIERALSYCADAYAADAPVEAAVEDHLLPGRGVVWVVYEADVDGDEVTDQTVKFDYVFWKDYLCSFGRIYADVWWQARRHLYTRDELKRYFPTHADRIPLNAQIDGAPEDGKDDTFKRACVWEVWDRTKKQRVYVAEDYDWLLKTDDDPYRLQWFFPLAEPLVSVRTTNALAPIPEYMMYQDQAAELDRVATRLYNLIEALKRRGVYDATMEGADNQLSQLMEAGDNQFVPYKGFAALMEKGGLKNVFQTEDISGIVVAVDKLYEKSAILIQRIYEVTGISDVLRGSSNPNETATAQRIKGQFGSLRINKRKQRIERFIRDSMRIKAEIIAEHFTREKLEEMTGIDMPLKADVMQAQQKLAALQQMMAQPQPGMQMPEQQTVKQMQATAKAVPWEDIAAILRSDQRRGYKIDIETAATAEFDSLEEKNARIEFLTSIQGYLERILPAAMAQPKIMPLARELTLFGMRAFKIGRSLEEAVDDAFDQLEQMGQQQASQGPQPDPKAEAEAERIKADIAAQTAKTQAMQQKAQMDGQIAMAKAGAEQQSRQLDLAAKQQRMAMDAEYQALELLMRKQKAEAEQAAASIKLGTQLQQAMTPRVETVQ